MKKILPIIMSLLLIVSLFSGCDLQSAEGREITDLNGNVIRLPAEVKSAASNSASVATHIIMIAGADAVGLATAAFDSGHTEKFAELFPGTDDVKLSEGNKISSESLLADGVNVFFTTKQEEADEYAKSGLICIVLNYDTIENIARTFEVIGEVFGADALARAKKISDHIRNSQSRVAEMVGDLPDENRPTVYYISASTQTTPYLTQGAGTSTTTLLEMCGAKQVTSGTGLDVTVSPEFILNENPDYILIDGYLAKEAYEELVNDPVLKELSAVKDQKIVFAPVGFFRPVLRPGAESGIGLLWLAGTFCPEKMAELSIAEEAQAFYSECFDWNFTMDEIQSMLYWTE